MRKLTKAQQLRKVASDLGVEVKVEAVVRPWGETDYVLEFQGHSPQPEVTFSFIEALGLIFDEVPDPAEGTCPTCESDWSCPVHHTGDYSLTGGDFSAAIIAAVL